MKFHDVERLGAVATAILDGSSTHEAITDLSVLCALIGTILTGTPGATRESRAETARQILAAVEHCAVKSIDNPEVFDHLLEISSVSFERVDRHPIQ